MEFPTDRPASAPTAAAARRVVFGFGVREIGIGAVSLAVLTAMGLWLHNRFVGDDRELQAVRTELAIRQDALDLYYNSFAALQRSQALMQVRAGSETTEAIGAWSRERARRFEALITRLDRERAARAYAVAKKEIEQLCQRGDVKVARAMLRQLPIVAFPTPGEYGRLRRELYEEPLAQFSRQNPQFYRALRQHEPEIARQDEALLRAEIASAPDEGVTPQLMLKVELLAAVAASDDPVVAEWTSLVSAIDYFENPDSTTLAHWRRAQRALRLGDWQAATDAMQAIVVSKVRTRQAFRLAYGRTLLRARPDQPAEAYPFLAEAAAAGDKQARAWVASEDLRQGRYAQARGWLEAAVADGESESVPLLVELYAKQPPGDAAEAERIAGMLERVTTRDDAPASAWLMLGRLYEARDPPGSGATRAYGCYTQAAEKASAEAQAEVARCALRGTGTAPNPDLARDAACRAFAGGEREKSVPILIELMRRAPDRTAGAVQRLFDQENVAAPAGYTETRMVDGPGVAQLRSLLARYFDQIGQYANAARLYGASRDPAAVRRHAELMASHPCQTCGGSGKVQTSAPCPTCGGKGRQICGFCSGSGFIYVPGTPPCPTCGGSGAIVQDRKVVTCVVCGGSGRGKGSVIKQDCPHCEGGYIRCGECTSGMASVSKECPDCHGRGRWTLAERGGE